jgi:hypothetical protein
MMARKATNLLGSVSLIGARLRKVTDKLPQAQGMKGGFVSHYLPWAAINWSHILTHTVTLGLTHYLVVTKSYRT